jgi:ABC-type nickel/cobalt efflux system permease component RcnA
VKQQSFYGAMSGSIRKLKSENSLAAAWTLLLLSFGYGVLHAAGPGHGKAVISAWLLATENELRRGILIAFLSSIIQALTAVAIVSALFLVVASVGAVARDVAGFLESASYGMIGLMGLYLVWTALRPHLRERAHAQVPGPALAHAHGAATNHAHHLRDHTFTLQNVAPPRAADHHVHDENCGCGHAHVPEAAQVRGDWSLAKAFSLAFAVGIRPCTGAILVLVFANALGLYWVGIASTLVMGVGTFITVSLIAAAAVYAKKFALRFAAYDSSVMAWTAFGLRLGGGLVIASLGLLLFWASLGSVNAMM